MFSTETLSRQAFVERVERDYLSFFDGSHVLVYLHIDRLKYYNSLCGIESGDRVLHEVIDSVAKDASEHMVARHAAAGIVFVWSGTEIEGLADFTNSLLPTFGEVGGLSTKLGYVRMVPPLDVDECMERASFACRCIENVAETYSCAFGGEVEQEFEKRSYIVDHLDEAIRSGEIEAWAQPIVRVLSGRICEVEVLARWQSSRYGALYPNEFIPVLEERQIIHKLDLEVIRLACSQWAEARLIGTNVPFGVNLSRLDFELCDIFTAVCTLMKRFDVPVEQVHIEVTESLASSRDDGVMEGVRRFREAGFQVYMDDFGSGYSSLGQVADLRFDVIKFDKGMLDHVVGDERSRVVFADAVSMVKRLGMQTLAEGVECEAQYDFLRAVGCEKAQGYLFGRPCSHKITMERLDRRARRHEDASYAKYLDRIGQVNLIDGTSASITGIEASTVVGRSPVAVIELHKGMLSLITSNIAFNRLVERIGAESFDELARENTTAAANIVARVSSAARSARDLGMPQLVDFVAHGVFCSATMVFVAQTDDREAYLTTVTSVEGAPTVTEHSLLMGLLETSHLCFFWKDTKRRFLGANKNFLDYYGFSDLGAILGKTDEDMGWNIGGERYHTDEDDVLAGHAITAVPGVCVCQGEQRDIIATKRPLYSHGAVVGLVGYFEDVGPHKGAGASADS